MVDFDDDAPDQGDSSQSVVDESAVWIGDREISKDEALKDVSKRFLYLLQTFFKGGRMKTFGNDIMIKIYFHAIMGAYLKDYTVIKGGGATDLRVPTIWVQNSTSGKSQLNKFGQDVCNKIGLVAVQETGFSEAGLIGTFDREKHNFNVKNNLHPGDEVQVSGKDGSTRTKRYQIPVTYGDMYDKDIIFIDEGKILFQPTRHTENILSILQPAMDYPGKVRKKLAAEEPIEYDCTCTLITSTVEFGTMTPELLLQGFFPRCIFFERKLSVFEYQRMHNELHRLAFDEHKYNELLNDFTELIQKHRVPISRERHKIKVREECFPVVIAAVNQWFRLIGDRLYGSEHDVAKSFASRMSQHIYKIAGQMAVINNHLEAGATHGEVVFEIGAEEIDYSLSILNPIFDGLLKNLMIGETQEDRQMYSTILVIMRRLFDANMESMPKAQIQQILMMQKGIGRNRAAKVYMAMFAANFFTEEKKGNNIYVKPNWKLWNERGLIDGGKHNGK